MSRIIAVDPGHKKCGVLLADLDDAFVLDAKVVYKDAVKDLIISWKKQYLVQKIILGNGTTSRLWEKQLKEISPVELIEEKGTTLLARKRYWDLWPPSNFYRLIPRGLMLPPDNLDAIAALVLVENYLQKKLIWKCSRDFKTWPEQ